MDHAPDIRLDSPLELRLAELVKGDHSHNSFPPGRIDRFQMYINIKTKLQEEIYPDIGSALAADGKGAAFTRHDMGHVDDVIRKAGQLLGASSEANTPALTTLKPYEVFALLVACLIHDAGNIRGRSGHAREARRILKQVSDNCLDQKELSIISKIASAHGGETASGNKDTIGELPLEDGVENATIRPRLLAAVLRLADELAENSRRANRREESSSKYPNLYCTCISPRIDYKSRRIALDFAVSDNDCALFAADESGKEMYFLDYIWKRVRKTELERRYCDRFLRGIATFEEIRVQIELLHNDDEWQTIHFELKESGYPSPNGLETIPDEKIRAEEIAKKYKELCAIEEEADE